MGQQEYENAYVCERVCDTHSIQQELRQPAATAPSHWAEGCAL